jgi:hypothetical protein
MTTRNNTVPIIGLSPFSILRLLCASFAGDALAVAHEYEISGTLSSEYAPEIAHVQGRYVYDFTATVSGDRWHIRTLPRSIPASPPLEIAGKSYKEVVPDYREASSDGHSFYEVISMVKSKKDNPKQKNAGQGLRGDGNVPYGLEDELICLWYLYASHDYLKRTFDSRIHPLQCLAESAYSRTDFRQPAEWTLVDPPGLPKMILTKGAADGVLFTNAWLRVSNFYSMEDLLLPAVATVEFFFLRPSFVDGKVVKTPSLHHRIEVVATAYKGKSEIESFVPALPVPSVVQDTRYWTSQPAVTVSRFASNWPDSKELDAAYSHSVRHSVGIVDPRRVSLGSRRTLVLVVLVAVALGPLLFFGVRRIQKHKTESEDISNENI